MDYHVQIDPNVIVNEVEAVSYCGMRPTGVI